jgi:NAD(P)-dependent dehydrogenase (short-subunit alcohol dehydrogenase family)
MRARGGGAVINVGSLAARVPAMPYNGFYAASKCALGALSESLAWELAPFGIRVVCVEPGFVATEISHKAWEGDPEAGPYAADHQWVNRFFVGNGEATAGDPGAVADAVVGAADDPDTPLHLLVGADAEAFVALAGDVGSHEGWVAAATGLLESVAGPRPGPGAR